ncbi:PhoX family protein [Steroidobacter agaridevorans]|uniref:PhoX family protein n=1 Tax=Steroidobacter agaridevorans TaxID=2695856 RepID=UPI00132C7411|nr:PhoX family phosphatase [Steroidobacter agaridevorans]GFE88361.1 dTDP-glucose 4,6-dehydratase [Steroidobacter agaridevorans]
MTRRAPDAPLFEDLLAQRLTRRQVLQAGAAIAPMALAGCAPFATSDANASKTASLGFKAIQGSKADAIVLPPGYSYDVVIRWGESLFSSVPDLDATKLDAGTLFEPTAALHQRSQFGQNCDAIHFFPLNGRSDHGVLCVNNEYTDDALMFPGHPGFRGLRGAVSRAFVEQYSQVVAVSKAAQGVSIVEVKRERGRWRFVKDSRYNRRITADTPIDIGGPARGAALMQTKDDPAGERAFGTFANCAGGETPWGTYLTAEENIQDYFANLDQLKARNDVDPFIVESHRRFRMWKAQSLYNWDMADSRFNLAVAPTEPFRFGWIVEIDPLDPTGTPVKRTALGRFAHEGASPVIARNGRVAVYMGDDDKFEYVYKFISNGRFDPKNRAANRNLLDQGTLHVARFDASGKGQWLPLVFDPKGPLNAAAGFRDQADVLIKARMAAYLLGATPMDRPEDVEANPTSGRIYIACTRNENRTVEPGTVTYGGREVDTRPNAANPRGANNFGHIIEIAEAGDDHTSLEFSWEVFLLAGDPSGDRLITDLGRIKPDSVYYAGYANAEDLSPIGSPDNIGFDRAGNLWMVTDDTQPGVSNNGCWAMPTTGPNRGRLQQFMSGPVGCEVCGCQFSPDDETLFISIQHPGEGGTTAEPRSHWPDGGTSQPRASVIAIRKDGGGVVGS